MPATTSFGYVDSIDKAKSLAIPDLNWSVDFAVTKNDANEVVLTNKTSPLDQPETFRFGYQSIANIYNNTGIDPSFMAVSKRGVSLVSQVNDILRVSCNSEDGCKLVRIDLPIESHVVLKSPINEYITADVALAVVLRAVSGLFPTGSVEATRLNAMLRHALMPTGL